MIDKKTVARHFSRAAATYDKAAVVQGKMARDLLAFCPEPGRTTSVLELGAGTGLLSDLLLRRYPDAAFTLVDISPGMTGHCREKYAGLERVRTLEADGEFYEGDGACYDLIVSGAAFQWYEDPAAAVARYLEMLHPGGRLVFSTFGPGTFRELFRAFEEAYQELGIPYARTQGQRLHAEGYWQDALFDFQLEISTSRVYTLAYPDVGSFLHSLRETGVTNAGTNRGETPLQAVRAMMRHYRKRFPGEIEVSYEGLFFSASKKIKREKSNPI